jgi:PAS domain S-box-containing protein
MTVRNGNQRLSERRLNVVWLIAGLLLSVALLFAANWEANRQEQVRMDAFHSPLIDLAKISESIINAQLRQYDDTLLVLRRVYAADPKRFSECIGLLRNGPLADREILVVLVDRGGYLTYTDSTTSKPGLYLGNRTYFRYFADGGKDRFYVDEPIFGRVTQRYSIPLARPIYDKKGAFLGVIALSVRQDSLANFGTRFQLSGDTAVTLVTQAGAVAGRSRDLAKVQGKIIPQEMLTPMLKSAEGVFSSRVIPDGIERVVAYRHIHDVDTPLIVYVETSPANVLRDASKQRAVLMWGAGFISLVIMVLIIVYLKGRKTMTQLIDTLRRSKEQEYETLTQTSLDGFWITDSTGRILDTNDTFCKVLGYTREELLCLSIMDFEAVESSEQVAAHIRSVMETGSDRFQSRYRCKDGTIIDVEISAQYTKEAGGRFFVFTRDITKRKRVEEELKTSEVRFRELFNHMSNGVAVYEAVDNGGDFIFRDFNPAAENIEKVSRKDILGKSVTEAFPGVKTFGIFEVFQRVWQTGNAEYFPHNIYKDERDPGSWRDSWIFKLPTGEIIAVYNDVTERIRAEEELRHTNDRLALAQNAAGTGIWDWDIIAGRIKWTTQMFDLFGIDRTKTEESFDAWRNALHPEDMEMAGLRIDHALKEKKDLNSDYRVVLPGGRIRWINAVGKGEYNEQNQPVRMLGICIDITDRKQAEAEIRKMNDELEHRVRGRTAQLEASNKELEAFSYSVSHDLRAPLRSIEGFSQALLEEYRENLDETGKNYLDRVCEAAKRMGMLIDDTLKLSRVARFDFQCEAVDLSRMVRQILETTQQNNPDRSVDIVILRSLSDTDCPLEPAGQCVEIHRQGGPAPNRIRQDRQERRDCLLCP